MNNKIKGSLLVLGGILLMSGCAQKVTVKALQPAEVSRAALTKKVAVTAFKNDKENISGKIEADLAKHKLDGKQYFTIVSRQDLNKVLKEQRIGTSGLIDPNTATEVGKLIGAQAIISGRTGNASSSDTHFYETRTRCNKNGCWKVRVSCTKRVAGLDAEIRMIDTKKGDIIYADTINKTASWKHCNDDSRPLPSTMMASQQLASAIASDFTYKLVPHYVYYKVALLDKPDLEYTKKQKALLKLSLAFIKAKRYHRAEKLLKKLINSTNGKSYVPLYDLGVLREAKGDYEGAKNLYTKADNLTVEPVDEINQAINHIDKIIEQNKQALKQLKK
jgi:curli biogenesis system outer membrane secretion channel CsgG